MACVLFGGCSFILLNGVCMFERILMANSRAESSVRNKLAPRKYAPGAYVPCNLQAVQDKTIILQSAAACISLSSRFIKAAIYWVFSDSFSVNFSTLHFKCEVTFQNPSRSSSPRRLRTHAIRQRGGGVVQLELRFLCSRCSEIRRAVLDAPPAAMVVTKRKHGNPRDDASLLSRWTYHFVAPLLDIGQKRPLQEEDLYELAEHDKIARVVGGVTQEWEQLLARAKVTGKRVSYTRALFNNFRKDIIVTGVFTCLESALKILQPVLLYQLIAWLSGAGEQAAWFGWTMAAAMGVDAIGQTLVHHILFYLSMRLGWNMKMAASGMVHAKVLRLGAGALQQTTQGQVINIVSNDVARFIELGVMGHFVWVAMLDVIAILILVSVRVGFVAAVAGVGTTLVLIPLQVRLGQFFAKNRSNTARFTDERVKVMGDVLASMPSVKAFAWEQPFTDLNRDIRTSECASIRKSQVLKAFNISVSFASPVTASLATFLVYWAQGKVLVPSTVFTTLGLLHILRMSLGMWSRGVESLAESRVSTRRIREFLLLPEAPRRGWGAVDASGVSSKETGDEKEAGGVLLTIDKADFSWQALAEIYRKDANQQGPAIPEGTVRIDLASGSVITNGSITNEQSAVNAGNANGHAATSTGFTAGAARAEEEKVEPAVAAAAEAAAVTISGIDLRAERGKLVIVVGPVGCGKSTLLEGILGEVPMVNGALDLTPGIRVAYASQKPFIRACCLRENVTFVTEHLEQHAAPSEDALQAKAGQSGAAVSDAAVAAAGKGAGPHATYDTARFAAALEACAMGPDVQRMPNGEETEIGERGINLSGGQKARLSLARAVYSDADLYLLDDPLSAVDPKVARHLFERCILGALVGAGNKAVVLVTHQLQCLPFADTVVVLDANGSQVAAGTFKDLQNSGLSISTFIQADEAREDQEDASESGDESGSERTMVAEDEAVTQGPEGAFPPEIEPCDPVVGRTVTDTTDRRRSRSRSRAVSITKKLVSATEREDRVLGRVSGSTYMAFAKHGKWWRCILCTGLMAAAQACFVMSDWWLKYWSSLDAGDQRNNSLALAFGLLVASTALLGLARSRLFFDLTLKASTSVHHAMYAAVMRSPMSFFNSNPQGRILNRFSNDQGSVDELLPVTAYNAIEIILFVVAAMALVCITVPYVTLMILPMAILFYVARKRYLASSREIKRLEAISRSPVAYGAEAATHAGFIRLLEKNGKAWLDLETSAFLMCTTLCAAGLKGSIDPGLMALALVYTLSLSGQFQWAVRESAEAENYMTAFERMLHYSKLPAEPDSGVKAPEDWPRSGGIEVQDLHVRYREDLPLVLKGITFAVSPGTKLGIVARTGAGKSSLVMALLRLNQVTSGDIKLDGVSLLQLGLSDARRHISWIPQDPHLFSGTLRFNLDPFKRFSDAEIWEALRSVQLASLPEGSPLGLAMEVAEGGSSLSVGQRQLAFRDCTVMTIAHRIHTVIDSDLIMVLSDGQLVELGAPTELADNVSAFHNACGLPDDQCGSLRCIAQ
ncbi:hypothetical protein JKP88DRAFT_265312 [Tribonema minus]|uniref:Uncharacterized protein n=1 Tax=Tribonema minus TaxID=303371 RepID=A0A836C8A2_9STRA|nr:hypothetical protein JKP88DRAFT_265312 [Tribonema minus]